MQGGGSEGRQSIESLYEGGDIQPDCRAPRTPRWEKAGSGGLTGSALGPALRWEVGLDQESQSSFSSPAGLVKAKLQVLL